MPLVAAPARGPVGFAVVDLEATGSSSRRHRVVELAVVLLGADLEPQGEFTTLVDPQGPVGPTHIHGIEPEHLGGAPRFAGIARRLLGLLRGRVLVGHNVGCDRAFLVAEYARVGLRLPAVPELCTMRLAERYGEYGEPGEEAGPGRGPAGGLSLWECAAAIGITDWSPHTALGDARASASLLSFYAPRAAGLGERLAVAAGTRWPEPSGPLTAGDALWMRRSSAYARALRAGRGNDQARAAVPGVRNEPA